MLRRAMTERNIGPEDNDTSTNTLLRLLEAAVLLAETEAADALAQLLEPVRSQSWSWIIHVCPARLLGAAAALLGKPNEARGYYEQALEASAKIRTGPPNDDEEDYALKCWAGVLPLQLTPGEPVPDPRLPHDIPVPAYARTFPRPCGRR